jgi:hypothetical protein
MSDCDTYLRLLHGTWDMGCGFSSLFFYARNLGYVVRLSGLRAYVDTCVSVVG